METISRDYAVKLRELADWLDAREEFPVDGTPFLYANYYKKEPFLTAVRALKPGKKEMTDGQYPETYFFPANAPKDVTIRLSIPRDKVCRKIQDVQWECEPFLSDAEEIGLAVTD